jgi:hypothetical protein
MRVVRRIALTGWIAAHACAVQLAARTDAHAQTPDRPVVVYVEEGSDVDSAQVRRAVAAELGARVPDPGDPLPAGAGLLHVRSLEGLLRVTFRDARGRTLEREVLAPSDARNRVRMIALLAGNLARNEADDLVGPPAPPTGEESAPPPAPAPPRPSAQDVPSWRVQPAETAPATPPGSGSPQRAPAPAPEARSDGGMQRTIGWVAIGTGAVAVGVGVALRIMATSDQNRTVSACPGNVCAASSMAELNAANSKIVASNWAFLLGGLAAATGVVLELTAPTAPNATTLAIGPLGVNVAHTW